MTAFSFQEKTREAGLKSELTTLMSSNQRLEEKVGLLGERGLLQDFISIMDLSGDATR